MIVTNEYGEKQIIVRLGETEKEIKDQMMDLALENNNWNITHAAKALGLKRTSLSMRLNKQRKKELASSAEARTKEKII